MRLPLLGLIILTVGLRLQAGTISVDVRNARGEAVRGAVIWAAGEKRPTGAPSRTAVMDQKDRTFVPHVLAIQTGTAVRFPNSDDVRHHVYSFSPPKPFQLPLYKGNAASPVVFDKPGVVTLGCNIHDQMSAFIVVVPTPYFEKTDAAGRAVLRNVDAGKYTIRVWYPEARVEPELGRVTIAGEEQYEVRFEGRTFTIKRAPADIKGNPLHGSR